MRLLLKQTESKVKDKDLTPIPTRSSNRCPSGTAQLPRYLERNSLCNYGVLGIQFAWQGANSETFS